MGIFGALLDRIAPADENGRGAADIALAAGGMALGAAAAAAAAREIGDSMRGAVSGGREAGDAISAASEQRAASASIAVEPPAKERGGMSLDR